MIYVEKIYNSLQFHRLVKHSINKRASW